MKSAKLRVSNLTTMAKDLEWKGLQKQSLFRLQPGLEVLYSVQEDEKIKQTGEMWLEVL